MTSTPTRMLATMPALFLAGLTLSACSGLNSRGQFNEDPLGNFEQQVIGNTLSGVGLTAPQREPIAYAPRAPLAAPPNAARGQLPPPQDREAALAERGNWPRDPDVARRAAASREANRTYDTQYERERDGRRMSVEEMEAQRNAGPRSASVNGRAAGDGFQDRNVVLSRDELERGWNSGSNENGGEGLLRVDETVDVTRGREEGQGAARRYLDGQEGARRTELRRLDTTRVTQQEPSRRTLIDPPAGMRAPAPDSSGGRITEEDLAQRPWLERMLSGLRN